MSQRSTRIVIVGGGFGGVYTARTLEKLLKHEIGRGEVERALVSRENYMVFQPMLPEVISGSIGILDTITPIRRLCQALFATLPLLKSFFESLIAARGR